MIAMECWKYSYDYNHLKMSQILALNNPWEIVVSFYK